jgi:hypothetical protein
MWNDEFGTNLGMSLNQILLYNLVWKVMKNKEN